MSGGRPLGICEYFLSPKSTNVCPSSLKFGHIEVHKACFLSSKSSSPCKIQITEKKLQYFIINAVISATNNLSPKQGNSESTGMLIISLTQQVYFAAVPGTPFIWSL